MTVRVRQSAINATKMVTIARTIGVGKCHCCYNQRVTVLAVKGRLFAMNVGIKGTTRGIAQSERTKRRKYMEKGFPIFLAHVTTKEIEDKSEKKDLRHVPKVKYFPESIPEDFRLLPPTSTIGYQIDYGTGASHLMELNKLTLLPSARGSKENIPKTAFQNSLCAIYEIQVMLFGFDKPPAVFKDLMNRIEKMIFLMHHASLKSHEKTTTRTRDFKTCAVAGKEREPPLRVRALDYGLVSFGSSQTTKSQTEARKPENFKSEDVGGECD
ncbi:hypothetical protein Tco_0647102 [Tanacetum coccineum]